MSGTLAEGCGGGSEYGQPGFTRTGRRLAVIDPIGRLHAATVVGRDEQRGRAAILFERLEFFPEFADEAVAARDGFEVSVVAAPMSRGVGFAERDVEDAGLQFLDHSEGGPKAERVVVLVPRLDRDVLHPAIEIREAGRFGGEPGIPAGDPHRQPTAADVQNGGQDVPRHRGGDAAGKRHASVQPFEHGDVAVRDGGVRRDERVGKTAEQLVVAGVGKPLGVGHVHQAAAIAVAEDLSPQRDFVPEEGHQFFPPFAGGRSERGGAGGSNFLFGNATKLGI